MSMSIKFRSFINYLIEAFKIYITNIHSIFSITLLMNIILVCIPTVVGLLLLSNLKPEYYYTTHGLGITISDFTDLLCCIFIALLTFGILILYDAVISVYAFYITFKTEDENYLLFLSIIKSHLWNIIKTKFIAFTYIAIGIISLILPGIVLALRYASINYFVIVEGSKFSESSIKSTNIMDGFKLLFLLISTIFLAINKYGMDHLNIIIDKSAYTPILYSVVLLVIATLFSTLNMLSSILTYNLCKNELHSNILETQEVPVEAVSDNQEVSAVVNS